MWYTWWRIELDRGFIWKLERSHSGFGVDGKNNNQGNLKDVAWEEVDWIQLARNENRWRGL
jgi:hypothetical protein